MEQIKFSRETKFTGRNGYFKCSGIELLKLGHNNSVMITPLTSKGIAARCDIEIPVEDIENLINHLQKIKPQ